MLNCSVVKVYQVFINYIQIDYINLYLSLVIFRISFYLIKIYILYIHKKKYEYLFMFNLIN